MSLRSPFLKFTSGLGVAITVGMLIVALKMLSYGMWGIAAAVVLIVAAKVVSMIMKGDPIWISLGAVPRRDT